MYVCKIISVIAYPELIFRTEMFQSAVRKIPFSGVLAHRYENAKHYKFMSLYNVHPLRGKSSLGGFKMHHDKFIFESPRPYRTKSELLR